MKSNRPPVAGIGLPPTGGQGHGNNHSPSKRKASYSKGMEPPVKPPSNYSRVSR